MALAVWQTWPVILSPLSQIPIGSEPVASVPLYNVWTIWWNSDRLAVGLQGYWDAPIFFSTPGAFALAEPQPITMLLAPVIWVTGSRVLAYNLFVWLSLVLNGVFTGRLLKVYGMGPWTTLWGGMAMVLLPIVMWQLGVAQLVPLWGILWTWAAIEQFCRQPTRLRGVALGAALGCGVITCMHQGLFLAVLLVGAAPALWRQWRCVRNWPGWLLALLVALLIVGPFAYKVHHAVKQHGIERGREDTAASSARPGDYLQAYGGQLIDTSPKERSWRMLSPGWIKLGLAVIGVISGLRRVDSRRWSSFLFIIAILAFLLSLGPNLRVLGWRPWWSLAELVPIFTSIRSVFRFAFFVHMIVVIFAAMGIYALHKTCSERLKHLRSQVAMRSVLILVACTAILEVHVRPARYATVPDIKRHRVWVDYVREHTPAGHGIVCFPFPKGYRVADYQNTTEWMYLGSFHGVPLVNGYSGHFPQSYHLLRHKLTTKFPSADKLRQIIEHKVKFLVLRRSVPKDRSATGYNATLGDYWVKHVCADENVDVFEVGGRTP
jgi:hypothetical protein